MVIFIVPVTTGPPAILDNVFRAAAARRPAADQAPRDPVENAVHAEIDENVLVVQRHRHSCRREMTVSPVPGQAENAVVFEAAAGR